VLYQIQSKEQFQYYTYRALWKELIYETNITCIFSAF